MRGARPSGCRLARSTLTGGSSNSGATPSTSSAAARFAATSFHRRSTRIAGYGSCPASTRSIAVRTALHLRRVEIGRVVRRRVTRGDEQRVAGPQRDVEVVGEVEHHLPARARSAGLDEAQVTRRDPRLRGEVELAQPTAGAPLAQQRADAACSLMPARSCPSPYRRRRARTITSEGIALPPYRRDDVRHGPAGRSSAAMPTRREPEIPMITTDILDRATVGAGAIAEYDAFADLLDSLSDEDWRTRDAAARGSTCATSPATSSGSPKTLAAGVPGSRTAAEEAATVRDDAPAVAAAAPADRDRVVPRVDRRARRRGVGRTRAACRTSRSVEAC